MASYTSLNRRYFQLGVAVPLRGHKFRFGTSISAALSGNNPTTVSGHSRFTIAAVTDPPALDQVFQAGDKIIVGPSTDADNEDAREILTVLDVPSATQIDVVGTAQYEYSDGDELKGIGEKLGAGWDISDDDYLEIDPEGIRDTTYGEDGMDTGPIDNYYQKVLCRGGNTIYQELGDILLPSTQYIFGCMFKVNFTPAGYTGGSNPYPSDFWVTVNDGTGDFLDQAIRYWSYGAGTDGGPVSTWSFFSTSIQSDYTTFAGGSRGVTNTAVSDCRIDIGGHLASEDHYLRFWIDSPFLCHAQGTDDYLSGIYTFETFPVLGSVQYAFSRSMKEIVLASGSHVEYDPTGGGGRVRKHIFSCQFEDVASTMFDNLMHLISFQDEGTDLVLLTHEYRFGDTVPSVIVGKAVIESVQPRRWDQRLRSFTFTFRET